MARIAGINIPNHQHAEIALTAIYGIGRSHARRRSATRRGVASDRKIKDLTDGDLEKHARGDRPASRSRATCAARCR